MSNYNFIPERNSIANLYSAIFYYIIPDNRNEKIISNKNLEGRIIHKRIKMTYFEQMKHYFKYYFFKKNFYECNHKKINMQKDKNGYITEKIITCPDCDMDYKTIIKDKNKKQIFIFN